MVAAARVMLLAICVAGALAANAQQPSSVIANVTVLDGRGSDAVTDMHAHLLFPRCAAGPDGSIAWVMMDGRIVSNGPGTTK